VKYAGCPLTWASKIQTEMVLSTTEAEFIPLGEGLRTVIPIMSLLEETQVQGANITNNKAAIKCKVLRIILER